MPPVAPDIAKTLEISRQNYLKRLPEELAALHKLALAIDGTLATRAQMDELHKRLHKLAGSGGTFGQHKLGAAAHALELMVNDWLADSGPVPSEALRTFVSRIAGMTNTLFETDIIRANVSAAPEEKKLSAADANTQHIWLVEDDAELGAEISRLLGQFNYEITLFTSYAEAEAAAAWGLPDAIILDVLFPDESINATEAFRSSPGLLGLDCPVIFISAFDDFYSRIRAVRLGRAGYLIKPLDIPKLVEHLERLFEARKAPPYRVLIVDDDTILAKHYQLVLSSEGVEAEVLDKPEQIIEAIANFRPELILMDMYMPDYSGPELAGVIRQFDEWTSLPIVYLSAESDLDKQIAAMGEGADDFLTKPISDARLCAAVKVRATRSRQLCELVSKDSLTGLLKHARIKEELKIEEDRSVRSGQALSVVMLDIDHFKTVNDTYGHATGDRVIKSVAHLLRQRLRKTDSIGRYGGEEFAIVLADCDMKAAYELIEDIRARFSTLKFQAGTQQFSVTLSAGIATTSPGIPYGELLLDADKALYQAKHGGRNQIRQFSP